MFSGGRRWLQLQAAAVAAENVDLVLQSLTVRDTNTKLFQSDVK